MYRISIIFCWFIIAFLFLLLPGLNGFQESIIFNLRTNETTKILTMLGNTTYVINSVNVPVRASVLIFQAHSQMEELTMSEQPEALIHSKVTGKNIGLAVKLQSFESTKSVWLTNKSERKISALLSITTMDPMGPIPGGCNMEFPTEIAPYLRLKSDTMHTYVEYQHASFGYQRNKPSPKCSLSQPYVTYEVYVLFLEENNFGEEEYLKKLSYMSSLSQLKEFSSKAMSYSLHPDTRYSFLMYPNLGVVYNVIAKYTIDGKVKEAAYIPIVSYGCSSLDFTEYGCRIQYSTIGKIFLFSLSIYAFLVAFFGYSFVGPDVFFFGLLASFLIGLILLGKYVNLSKQNIAELSIVIGLLGGSFFLFLWLWLHNIVILLLLIGLVFGFLLTAAIFYTPLGNLEIFVNQSNFWAVFIVGVITVSAFSIAIPAVIIILGTSITGPYAMLLFYDDFIGTRLSYIVLNVIKRAVSPSSDFAFNDYPFQGKDILMTTIWGALSLISMLLWCKQLFYNRSRASSASLSFLTYPVQRNRLNTLYTLSEDVTFQPLLRNGNTTVYRTFS
ncbi:hypothetical protein JTE90_001868 [Oedothorax gibbosus]|uniref:TM7S3/TM198-like domain-containing protein n=1 Tax=Oedothorax gibbosus TaxID=931172 RepID=A0AAV6VMW9_9ARAC|nr:hypothetical protein JTE90_001868 [Oedothorax gibbosus]